MLSDQFIKLVGALDWQATAAILLLTLATYTLVVVVYRLYFHPLHRYPGPFLARTTTLYAFYHASKADTHMNIYRLHKIYGDFVRIQPNLLSINRSSALKDLYGVSSNVQKGRSYKALMEQSGAVNTFNSIDKTVHARKRKIMAPCFSDAAMKAMEESILPYIRTLCEIVSVGREGGSWTGDLGSWGNYMTFDIMGKVAFGKEFGMLEGSEVRKIPKMIEENSRLGQMASCTPYLFKWGLDKIFFPANTTGVEKLRAFAKSQVRERMSKKADNAACLDRLLNAKDEGNVAYMDPMQMVAEARALVIAGSDTTATQVAANFFYLATHPAPPARLAAELRSTFAQLEEIRPGPTLDACKFLKATVEETLRMSPSVPGLLPREVLPGGITVSGHAFPAGVELAVPIYALHHNETYYLQAHKHVPERWLAREVGDEAVEKCWSAFTPFSHGPRGCVGKRLAYLELWVAVARMVWLFELEFVGGGREMAFGDRVWEYRLRDHGIAVREGPIVRCTRRKA